MPSKSNANTSVGRDSVAARSTAVPCPRIALLPQTGRKSSRPGDMRTYLEPPAPARSRHPLCVTVLANAVPESSESVLYALLVPTTEVAPLRKVQFTRVQPLAV